MPRFVELWIYLSAQPLFGLTATLVVYLLAQALSARVGGAPWANPVLWSVVVLASLMVATAILLESSLSFLGLGDPNLMSWGFMIGSGRSVIRLAWWMSVFPGVAIFLTVLSLNLVGEGLSDALNPRLARRRG